ncbi:MAG: cardiolipin synthase [Candidatus Abyssubacteria bacterium]
MTDQTFSDFLIAVWTKAAPYVNWGALALIALLSWASALHALLNKRDSRAALTWIAFCLMFPPLGPVLYFLFGINRVRTRGQRLGGSLTALLHIRPEQTEGPLTQEVPASATPEHYRPIARLSDRVTHRQLLAGNRVEPLQNGEQAYPAMLDAIEGAQHSLYLSTYIMDTDTTGQKFITALAHAVRRGVDVRVILDGVGELYSLPRAGTLLTRAGVPVARFLPPTLLPPSLFINLRNHCKILVADGNIGFTGGMNIGDRHLAANLSNPSRVEDIHFRVLGPVVTQMEQIFLAHWGFCTGEETPHTALSLRQTANSSDSTELTLSPLEKINSGTSTQGPLSPRETGGVNGKKQDRNSLLQNAAAQQGDALCRAIVDGPNEDMDRLAMILVGATAAAQHRVFIMTPYFLPSRELIGALQSTALRGVDVRVLLPSKNNLPYVKWASDNMLWQLLQEGVRIAYQPPPFVHSKLFLVDDFYSVIGSANIDPRSLRLNFELDLEIFSPSMNTTLAEHFLAAFSRSRETSLAQMDGRPLPIRIRDALCWLFTPYL